MLPPSKKRKDCSSKRRSVNKRQRLSSCTERDATTTASVEPEYTEQMTTLDAKKMTQEAENAAQEVELRARHAEIRAEEAEKRATEMQQKITEMEKLLAYTEKRALEAEKMAEVERDRTQQAQSRINLLILGH